MLGQRELRRMVAETLTGLRPEELSEIGELEYVDPKRNFAKINAAA